MINSEKMFVESEKIKWEAVAEGVKRKILGYDEKIMMVHVEFKKGGIGALHKHPHSQVTFLAKGVFEVQIGDEKKVLKQGDCFYIPPDIIHGVVTLEDGTLIDVFSPMREDFVSKDTVSYYKK
jgi:quercetin dioxygenase-like cupin family protein